MEKVLRDGVLQILVSDSGSGGLTGETHLITHDNKKYVLRKCADVKIAKYYENVSRKFERYGFLPKFLGRINENIFYEYIEGRDLKIKYERFDNLKQVGKILSRINSLKFRGNYTNNTNTFLNELESGKYKYVGKIEEARKKRGVRKNRRKIISNKEKREILRILDKIKSDMHIVYECVDPSPSNFRVRNGLVYLVDIEAIKPQYKGIGISKLFSKWAIDKNKRDVFIEGYGSKNIEFFDSNCKAFTDLNFLIKRLWCGVQLGFDHEKLLKKIKKLVKNLNSDIF